VTVYPIRRELAKPVCVVIYRLDRAGTEQSTGLELQRILSADDGTSSQRRSEPPGDGSSRASPVGHDSWRDVEWSRRHAGGDRGGRAHTAARSRSGAPARAGAYALDRCRSRRAYWAPISPWMGDHPELVTREGRQRPRLTESGPSSISEHSATLHRPHARANEPRGRLTDEIGDRVCRHWAGTIARQRPAEPAGECSTG
jgi:hypothetical protein